MAEVHEVFERRRDKLRERRVVPPQETTVVGLWRAKGGGSSGLGLHFHDLHFLHLPAFPTNQPTQPTHSTNQSQECFAPSSLFDVRDITTVRGERRTINFFSRARLDGLVRREELLGAKISEIFTGRDDRLEYRSATFGAAAGSLGGGGAAGSSQSSMAIAMGRALQPSGQQPAGETAGQQQQGAGGAEGAGGGPAAGEGSLAIVKMTEKFGRDPSKPADEDVWKRVFHVAAGRTELRFHHGEGRVTAGYVVLQQDGAAQAVQVRENSCCLV